MKHKYKIIGISILSLGALCLLLNFTGVQALIGESSAPLSGVVIVVDPGHGGKDDGAQNSGIKEQGINLAISQKLKAKLEAAGASVVLTRDGDYDLSSEGVDNRKRDDMKKRVALINEEPSDLFISVHLNAFPNTSVHGSQVFYKTEDASSQALAQLIQDRLNQFMDQNKTIKTGDFYILNNTERPGVLVECGYLSNANDRNKLTQEAYQDDLANLLYDCVLEYLQVIA